MQNFVCYEMVGQQIYHLVINYHDERVRKHIGRQKKGLKNKFKVSCPTFIYEYNKKRKFFIKLKASFVSIGIFFNFLDIGVVNSEVIHDKNEFCRWYISNRLSI